MNRPKFYTDQNSNYTYDERRYRYLEKLEEYCDVLEAQLEISYIENRKLKCERDDIKNAFKHFYSKIAYSLCHEINVSCAECPLNTYTCELSKFDDFVNEIMKEVEDE